MVSDEDAAQIDRLRYGLAHGVKEGLVEKVLEWPGVHGARALMTGEAEQGYWFDGTQEYAARRREEDFDRMRFATIETLTLSPLPCWKHLSEGRRRQLITNLVAEIESEAAARRQLTGRQVLGASAVRGQHPLFHTTSKAARQELYTAYRWFVAAFRGAAEKLRAGNLTVPFPPGSFPPALPFVTG